MQPLAVVVLNGSTALESLRVSPPNLRELAATIEDIVDDARRASETMDGIRALFRWVDRRQELINLNEIVRDVLASLHEELNDRRVQVSAELTEGVSIVRGNGYQLKEVVFNLVHNAMEAMDANTDRDRILWVRTEVRDRATLAVSVQDTGPGIDPSNLDTVFDAFFSTKKEGRGLGLAICRYAHGRRIGGRGQS